MELLQYRIYRDWNALIFSLTFRMLSKSQDFFLQKEFIGPSGPHNDIFFFMNKSFSWKGRRCSDFPLLV